MTRMLICTTLLASFSAPALAADYDAAGTGHGTSLSTPKPLRDDLIVVQVSTDYERFDMEDASGPLSSMAGPCFGSVLIDAGKASGGGYCLYTDADGDQAAIQWLAEEISPEGRTVGTWSIAGSSGKWAEAAGGGGFSAGVEEGSYTNIIDGDYTVP